jgi:hypothetical protein
MATGGAEGSQLDISEEEAALVKAEIELKNQELVLAEATKRYNQACSEELFNANYNFPREVRQLLDPAEKRLQINTLRMHEVGASGRDYLLEKQKLAEAQQKFADAEQKLKLAATASPQEPQEPQEPQRDISEEEAALVKAEIELKNQELAVSNTKMAHDRACFEGLKSLFHKDSEETNYLDYYLQSLSTDRPRRDFTY